MCVLTASLNHMSSYILESESTCIDTNRLCIELTNPELRRDSWATVLVNAYRIHYAHICFVVMQAHSILVPMDAGVVQIALEGSIHGML